MQGYVTDIDTATGENTDFRRVLYTARNLQLVLMSIPPGGEIGEEVHPDGDQFFRIEEGNGEVMIDGTVTPVEDGHAVVVPAGARHNLVNTGDEPLQVYTLYAPPEHKDGTVHRTSAEAAADEAHFDGGTTE